MIGALAAEPPRPMLLQRLRDDGGLHAPFLLDVEVLSALRGLAIGRKLSLDRANDARRDYGDLLITRYPHQPLSDRAWALRDNLTAYEALYVALAELLEVPLVTGDAGLTAAPGHTATVEVW